MRWIALARDPFSLRLCPSLHVHTRAVNKIAAQQKTHRKVAFSSCDLYSRVCIRPRSCSFRSPRLRTHSPLSCEFFLSLSFSLLFRGVYISSRSTADFVSYAAALLAAPGSAFHPAHHGGASPRSQSTPHDPTHHHRTIRPSGVHRRRLGGLPLHARIPTLPERDRLKLLFDNATWLGQNTILQRSCCPTNQTISLRDVATIKCMGDGNCGWHSLLNGVRFHHAQVSLSSKSNSSTLSGAAFMCVCCCCTYILNLLLLLLHNIAFVLHHRRRRTGALSHLSILPNTLAMLDFVSSHIQSSAPLFFFSFLHLRFFTRTMYATSRSYDT